VLPLANKQQITNAIKNNPAGSIAEFLAASQTDHPSITMSSTKNLLQVDPLFLSFFAQPIMANVNNIAHPFEPLGGRESEIKNASPI